jgi:hypothetical protein
MRPGTWQGADASENGTQEQPERRQPQVLLNIYASIARGEGPKPSSARSPRHSPRVLIPGSSR